MSDAISKSTWRLLVASNLPKIGKSTLWRIASSPDYARAQSEEDLAALFPELSELDRRTGKYELAIKRASYQVEQAEALGCSILGYWDREYPRTLRKAPSAPALFWFKGDQGALKKTPIAVIGTREPTKAGQASGYRIARAIAASGACIVSGLALGIDTIAHDAAIDAGGATIAVLPGGLDQVAPRSNARLAERITESGGGLLSEFPIGLPPLPANFITRDTTQAAIAAAVVLVQSDTTGGSLHASRAAIKLRRRLVVAAPTTIDLDNSEPKIGANKLFARRDFSRIKSLMSFPDDVESLTTILEGRDQYEAVVNEANQFWTQLNQGFLSSPRAAMQNQAD